MNCSSHIIGDIQKQVVAAINTKIPEHYHEDARALFPQLGQLIQGAVAHYNPQNVDEFLHKLQGNNSPGGKLLLELLTDPNPLYFMAEVERKLILRKKGIAKIRQDRRNAIAKTMDTAVKRVAKRISDAPPVIGGVSLLDFLVANTQATDLDPLRPVADTPFWQDQPNREMLKHEIDIHIYYFVVRLLDALRSYQLPEEVKLTMDQCTMVRAALIFVLHEIFANTLTRIQKGTFFHRKTSYGNRGDRSMDKEIFLNPKRRKGLVALFGDIKRVYER